MNHCMFVNIRSFEENHYTINLHYENSNLNYSIHSNLLVIPLIYYIANYFTNLLAYKFFYLKFSNFMFEKI